jgi:hypothetical protein
MNVECSLFDFGVQEKEPDPREFTDKGSITSGLAGSQSIREELNSDRWETTRVDMRERER